MRFVPSSICLCASTAVAVLAGTLLLQAQNGPDRGPGAAGPEAGVRQPATNPSSNSAEPPVTQPGAAPDRPQTGASTKPTTGATTHPVQEISLNFKDVPVDTILDYFSDKAGFVVIKEAPVDGRVTVQSRRPVSPEEAVVLLGAVLRGTGHTAVQDGRVLKIISAEKAKKGNLPVHFGADPSTIEVSEALITQVIPIRNIDAGRLKQDLAPMIGTDADVTANDASNSIIITDVSSRIHRIVEIINTLDTREVASTDLRFVRLKNANAATTAKLLTTIFKGDAPGQNMDPRMMQQMQQQGQNPPQPSRSREGRVPGGAIDQALRGGKVNAVADDRTNSLIITAPTETLKVIDGIIKDLDSDPVLSTELKPFQLIYGQAESTAKLINSIFKGDDRQMSDYYMMRIFGESGNSQQSKTKVTATADERTNTVVISAPAESMKGIETLIKQLDSNPAASADVRIYTLKFHDAYDAAKLIKEVFNPESKDSGDNPLRYLIYGGMMPSSQKNVKVTASSDYRTNTLVVTAPTELLKPIESLIKQLDSNPATEETVFVYRLRNAQSANLEFVLNSLFGNNSNQQNQQNPNQQGQDQQQQSQQQGFGGGRSGRNGGGSGSSNFGSNNSNNAGGSKRTNRNTNRNQRGNTPQMQGATATAITEMTGEVFIVANQDTNSLIVTTKVKYQDQVRQIIEELDRPVPQVLIKVLVAEVTHDNAADFGVDFSVLNRRANGNGQTYTNNLGNTAAGADGGLVVGLVEKDVTATLHALATEGKLDVLSRPYILASDNQVASITVGQEIPFITNSRVTETSQTISDFQYRDIGIILYVTPHINADGIVVLDVTPEISSLTSTNVSVGANVTAPVISKRSADTRVNIRNGQTIVIGGLMEDRRTSTISKIPIIGDLPLIGPAFSRTQISKTKTELLIFLTPHVALEPDSLAPMSRDELSGTKVTTRAVAPGVFEDHMRGLRRGANASIATQPSDPLRPINPPPMPPETQPENGNSLR